MKKKWDLQSRLSLDVKNFDKDKLIKTLLENRGIKTKKQIDEFLNPSMENLTARNLEIDEQSLKKSIKRIKIAIKNKEKIIVFGDYDADGVCGTATLWETLDELNADVMPYIPHRVEEGYGLSVKGIANLLAQYPETRLIITVDNGIVASKAVDYANSLGIDVIITDHHVPGPLIPKAFSIVHSTLICGAAVSWFLSRELAEDKFEVSVELAAIASVTDVMKLTKFNRIILKTGLEEIKKSKRPGLLAIIKTAGIEQEKIGVYELGHVIGPRINATGRLEHAIDSLRLICTRDPKRAEELAKRMDLTNQERQSLTIESFIFAKELVGRNKKKLLFVNHEIFEPGVIGLVAGRLTEEFYRPSIVLSVGDEFAKGSARSIAGFNIIDFIRMSSDLLVDAGGHPMAAGFTVEKKNIKKLQEAMEKMAEKELTDDLLTRTLRIDCELDLNLVNEVLFEELLKLSPFGPGNPEPVFLAKKVTIGNIWYVGQEKKHLKVELRNGEKDIRINGILFNYDVSLNLTIGKEIDIVFSVSQNEWNGNKRLELKLRDVISKQ